MQYTFRKAVQQDASGIWEILQQAIARRKADGSTQWQDGYPNLSVIEVDIAKEVGFVLTEETAIAGYCAVLQNDEPAYAQIEGAWLTQGSFLVVHRVAVSERYLGQGIAKRLLKSVEALALKRGIYSIKADTNFDNLAMMHIFEKLGYTYCGDILMRGSARRAYEKVLLP